jgi:NAD-dependent deacetylase
MDVTNTERIRKVAGLLRKAGSVLFITGAGISADSGIPTYRGIGGLYNDRTTADGIPIETALAGETLRTRPGIIWKYLAQIENRCRGAKHNRAHEILAGMEARFERVWVLTQNIDGLHQAAGSKNVIDLHGDMYVILCERCGWRTRVERYEGFAIPPRCPRCGAAARPDVVFFGEWIPPRKVEMMERVLAKPFDVYFSIGTTSVFPYISQPMVQAAREGRPTVEINPDRTGISEKVDIRISLGAAEALEAIWKALAQDRATPRFPL